MPAKELTRLVQWFDDYEDATQDARELSERDRDFYDGKQWTAEEAAELKERGQPASVFNRVAPKIDFILGMESQTRTTPKAVARTPMEDEGAAAATDAVRFVMDLNDWDQERSDCGEDLFIEGTCGIDVRVEDDDVNGGKRVVLERIPWDRLFWDPRSRFHDFRDAKFFGTVVWMDSEDAEAKWPDTKDIIEQSVGEANSGLDDTFDDRPRFGLWSDHHSGRTRVKVSQIWYHVGDEWYVATYTKAGFFEKPVASPYIDDKLNSVPGLILQSAKVDRNNDRYGTVRPLISPQEEINKRRSKSLHLLAKPDGYIEVRPEARFDISPTGDMTSGHFNLLQEAKAEIDSIGANSALTGKDPRQHSGRAIQARQQGGAIELNRLFDRFRAWQLRVYRQAWMRVRQFWTEERMVRVTDDERNIKYLGINTPLTVGEMLEHKGVQLPPPEQRTPDMQAQLEEVAGKKHELASMDIDIIMDESPDVLTLQDEQFEQLSQLLGSLGGALPPPTIMLMLKLMIESSGLRSKKQLVEMIDTGGVTPEQQQQAQQEQEQQKQIQMQNIGLEMQKKEADIGKTKASTFKDMAEGQSKLHETVEAKTEASLRSLGLSK